MARDFNGSTDRIDYANVANAICAQTFSAWCIADRDSTTAAEYLFEVHQSGDAAIGLTFSKAYQVSPPTWAVAMTVTGATTLAWRTTDVFPKDTLLHILFTWDGGTQYTGISVYVNGTQQTPTVGAGSANGATLTAATGSWSLAGRIFDDARNFDVKLAAVGWWNRVLTAGEIAGLVAGFSPLWYPQGLKFAPDLDGLYGVNNPLGGAATLDGTSILPHPRIIYPAARKLWGVPSGAVFTGNPYYYYAQCM